MVYSVPAGTDDFVAGTTIESGKVDSLSADIAADLNNITNGTNWFTGPLKAADGTVLLPGITFNSDPDVGFYRIAPNRIGVTVGGVKAAEFASTYFIPGVNDTYALGIPGTAWSDAAFASGALIDFGNGNMVLTHSSGVLTASTGDLRVTTAGTNAASVVTVGGTQTLTAKTLTLPVISSISNTGTLTLPTSTDTLVGQATTDTLTNKTLTSPAINTPTIIGGSFTDGTDIAVADGGTGASTAAAARTNLGNAFALNPQTVDYTVVAADRGKIIQMGAAAKTITMTASTLGADFIVGITVNTTANAVTLDDGASATNFFGPGYNGTASVTVYAARSVRWFWTDGTNWRETHSAALDINTLTADATPNRAADYVASWDASAATFKKVLFSDLVTEAGSWTPSLRINGVTTGITGSQAGSYKVYGNSLVVADFNITLTNKGAQVGLVTIEALPKTASADLRGTGGGISSILNTDATMLSRPFPAVASGATTFHMRFYSGTGDTQVTNSHITNITVLIGQVIYYM